MTRARQPELVPVHRWVRYDTRYPHDWRMCPDCQVHEQVPCEAADRLQDPMDAVHQERGQDRLQGRRGRGRLNAGPSGKLLAAIDARRTTTRITTEKQAPRKTAKTREFKTVALAAWRLRELARAYHATRDQARPERQI